MVHAIGSSRKGGLRPARGAASVGSLHTVADPLRPLGLWRQGSVASGLPDVRPFVALVLGEGFGTSYG